MHEWIFYLTLSLRYGLPTQTYHCVERLNGFPFQVAQLDKNISYIDFIII